MTLKLVLRGLWRHKLRSFITIGSVIFGHFLGLIFIAMNGGGHETMIEIGIRQGSAGHVVIQAPGFQQNRAVELVLPDGKAFQAVVQRAVPNSRSTLRAFGNGLARTSSDSVGVMMVGVEPQREKELSEVPSKIVRGVYLGSPTAAIKVAEKKKGSLWCAMPRKADAPPIRQVVVGVQLAKTLKLDLCSKLVIDAQGLGSREAEQFRVVGIFKTGSQDLDAFFVQIGLPDVQRLLQMGSDVHQLAVFVDSVKLTEPTAAAIREALTPAQRRSGEVLAWDKAMPEMAEFMWIDEASGWVFLIILYLIVAIGIVNTILMSVMERTRELGIMRALGASPWRISRLVLAEGAVIGVLGMVLGSLFAWPLLDYLATTGLDLTSYTEGGAMEAGGVAMTIMKARISGTEVIWAAIGVLLMSITAALYPAIRAARLRVLKAIYHV